MGIIRKLLSGSVRFLGCCYINARVSGLVNMAILHGCQGVLQYCVYSSNSSITSSRMGLKNSALWRDNT